MFPKGYLILTDMFLVLAVGLISGYIFFKMKVPGGMMIGAIIGVAALNIFFGVSHLPSYVKQAAQITAGAFIGCSVEKSDIRRLKYIVRPALVILSSMLMLNIILGFVIYFISPLDLPTSLMSCVPGGMSDIPIISADMGADVPKVAILQFVRMTAGLGLFPSLIALIARRRDQKNNASSPEKSEAPSERVKSGVYTTELFIQTIAIAALGGIMGSFLNIPAGVLLFSMLSVIGIKLIRNKAYMPMWAKRLAQVLSGTYIGCGMSFSDVLELKYLILPALILISSYFITCLITGNILCKYFGMSIKEAMLAATPAGASDMALISSDLGVQSADLIVLQIIRLVVVVSLFPQIIHLIIMLVG